MKYNTITWTSLTHFRSSRRRKLQWDSNAEEEKDPKRKGSQTEKPPFLLCQIWKNKQSRTSVRVAASGAENKVMLLSIYSSHTCTVRRKSTALYSRSVSMASPTISAGIFDSKRTACKTACSLSLEKGQRLRIPSAR